MSQSVVFSLDTRLYAISLSAVRRVVQAVELTPLPNAPPIVKGVINLGGLIIPVVNIRRRFRLPERELELSDQFIVATALRRDLHEDGGRSSRIGCRYGGRCARNLGAGNDFCSGDTAGPGTSGRGGKDRRWTDSDPRPRNLPLPGGRRCPRGDPASEYSMSAIPPFLLERLSQFVAARMGLHFPQERWGDLANGLALAARSMG